MTQPAASNDSKHSNDSWLPHGGAVSPARAQALAQRYGHPLAAWPSVGPDAVIESMLAHRSVRGYLDTPLPAGTLPTLIAAAQSAPTSSNLQTWSVVAVQDPERKARLAELAGGQAHIRECPLFLVWLADLSRLDRTAQAIGEAAAANRYFEMFLMASIDAALAAQNALVAAESMGLGTVYIGAMRNQPERVAAELQLPEKVVAVFGMCVGYPDPARLSGVKPRLDQEVVLFHERYGAASETARVSEYDERMLAFQSRHGMPATNWSRQSSSRVAGPQSLSGRDRLKQALAARGFGLE